MSKVSAWAQTWTPLLDRPVNELLVKILPLVNQTRLGPIAWTVKHSKVRPCHQGGAHGGRAPAKIVRAPAKITGLFMYKKSKKTKWQPCDGGWSRRLSHTNSYPGCHAPDHLVVAPADHGCSQHTSIAAYDYSWFVSFPMTHGHF